MTEDDLQRIEAVLAHNGRCTGYEKDCYIELDNEVAALIAEVRRMWCAPLRKTLPIAFDGQIRIASDCIINGKAYKAGDVL